MALLVTFIQPANAQLSEPSSKNYTGEWIAAKYPNGRPVVKEHYLKGKKTGTWISYYEGGEIMMKAQMRNDSTIGEAITYYVSGKIQKKAQFRGNIITSRSYFENGQVEISQSTVNGKQDGEWTRYYGNGVLMVKGNYEKGKNDGEWINNDKRGNLAWIGVYQNGVLVKETFYDEHGNVKIK